MTAVLHGDKGSGRRLSVVWLSIALYLGCLAAPAVRVIVDNSVGGTGTHEATGYGVQLALFGWLALFVGNVGWLANPAYVASLVATLLGRRRLGAGLACAALLLALHSLMLIGVTLPADEGYVNHQVLTHLGLGFFLWMSAMGAALVGALWATDGKGKA